MRFRTLAAARARFFAIVFATFWATVCASGCGDNLCSPDDEKQFVLEQMQQHYLWEEHLPDVNIDDFDSAPELLNFLRYRPEDRDKPGFSSIVTISSEERFLGAGESVGYGFSYTVDSEGRMILTQVYAGPAREAGFERGFEIVAIDGSSTQNMSDDVIDDLLGPREIGVSRRFTLRDRQGKQLEVTVVRDVFTIESVPVVRVLDTPDRKIGYVSFRTFNRPAEAALTEAFASFADQDVGSVVLDLRYNGGGLVFIAEHLGNILGGRIRNKLVFSETRFNKKQNKSNHVTLFDATEQSFELERLVIITSKRTASASEIIINSMAPHLDETDFAIVGAKTFGKPVGSAGFPFCDNVLRPISFETVNALGQGQYFDGIDVTCTASDDLGFVLGDPNEDSLQTAIAYINDQQCPLAPQRFVSSSPRQQKLIEHQMQSQDAAERYVGAK